MSEKLTEPLAPSRPPVPSVKCCSPSMKIANVSRSSLPAPWNAHSRVPQLTPTHPTKVSVPLTWTSPETMLRERASSKIPVPEMPPAHVSSSPKHWIFTTAPVHAGSPHVPGNVSVIVPATRTFAALTTFIPASMNTASYATINVTLAILMVLAPFCPWRSRPPREETSLVQLADLLLLTPGRRRVPPRAPACRCSSHVPCRTLPAPRTGHRRPRRPSHRHR